MSLPLGAVIHHTVPKREEESIAYASHSLSSMEKKYVEKEASGMIQYDIKKFLQYLWGRHFNLLTILCLKLMTEELL